ncbi:MAG TPA: hypothetical protein PLV87_14980, partial [Opitutaceae bacterium]|nr:hypothetical protein [Opitutaceae bacterium]
MIALSQSGAGNPSCQIRSAQAVGKGIRPAAQGTVWCLRLLACLFWLTVFTVEVPAVERDRRREAEKPEISVDPEAVQNRPGAAVATYADVVEAAQKAVVSVNITKIITQRRPVNPLFDH